MNLNFQHFRYIRFIEILNLVTKLRQSHLKCIVQKKKLKHHIVLNTNRIKQIAPHSEHKLSVELLLLYQKYYGKRFGFAFIDGKNQAEIIWKN